MTYKTPRDCDYSMILLLWIFLVSFGMPATSMQKKKLPLNSKLDIISTFCCHL